MNSDNWNEEKTRKVFIDRLLIEAGWGPITHFGPGKKYLKGSVEEYETENGPADYVLFHAGRPIAIVEGKKVAVGPQNVLTQA
jgi:type I restriction enzyme, R subunit